MTKNYYAVKRGKDIRVSKNPHTSGYGACLECFGLANDEMLVKNLGDKTSLFVDDKQLQEKLRDTCGWIQLMRKNSLW